jgi:hypothetical protein
LVAIFLTPLRSLDLWWHLDAGRWMLAHGHYLGRELRSFSLPGAEWTNFAWLFQVLVAAVRALAGAWGLLVLKSLVWWGILALLLHSAPRISPWAWLAGVLAVSWQVFPAMHLRPHLFEGLFLAASVALFHRRDPRRQALYSGLLILLWANMHASVVLGAAGLALHHLLPRWRLSGRDLARRLPTALGLALLVFATPNGLDILDVLQRHAQDAWLHVYIREWLAPQTLPPLMFVILAGVLASLWLGRPLMRPAEAFLLLAFVLIGGESKRFLYELGLLLIRPGALLVDGLLRRLAEAGRWRAGAFAGLSLVALVLLYPPPLALRGLSLADYPVQTRLYPGVAMPLLRPLLRARPIRVWNAYGWGGYLAWRGHGRIRIYIDGRTPTVFSEEMLLQASLARHRPTLLRRLLRQYRVDALVLRIGGGPAFAPDDPEWALVGFDAASLVYLRQDLARQYGLARIRFDPLRPWPAVDDSAAAGQVEALRALLERYPDNALAWRRLAQLLSRWPNDPDLAGEMRAAYRQALRLDPGDVQAAIGLARALRSRPRGREQIVQVIERLMARLDGRPPLGREVELAALLLDLGRARMAQRVLSPADSRRHQALDRDPRVWRLRERAATALGDAAQAGLARRMLARLSGDAPALNPVR